MLEIVVEGELEKESEQAQFTQMLEDVCKKHYIKMEEDTPRIVIDICPQGKLLCTYAGTRIHMVANTGVIGPGFHVCVTQIIDDILHLSAHAFHVYDSTNYFERRDFEELKYTHFYPWLQEIANRLVKQPVQEEGMCICWPKDEYEPMVKKGYASTLLGYMAIDDFVKKDIDELAQAFFIWNQECRDAHYFRNCAMARLWKDCFYEYSLMNEATCKTAHTIIDYLEAAYEMDASIALPYDVYDALCDVLHREKVIQGVYPKRTIDIGYRKGWVWYHIGNFMFPCMGFAEKAWDAMREDVILTAPYTEEAMEWEWLCKVHVKNTNNEQLTPHHEDPKCFDLTMKHLVGRGCVDAIDDGFVCSAWVYKEEETLETSCIVRKKEDIAMICEWVANCK